MTDTSTRNKHIAKNTLLLYVRMLLTMAVTLYTSRVVLQVLGVEDFGIYNVVGGVISLLGFLNASLSGAGSRFITFALGKEDKKVLNDTFSTVLCIHLILAIIILIFGETLGLWFVCNKLVIPESRITAAICVYQCSVLTTIVSVISVPYNSLIIAHEKMDAFAYISILEVSLKLGIALALLVIPYDHLIVYGMLYLLVQILIRAIYNKYCFKHFQESRTPLSWNQQQMKEIGQYALWTVNGNLAVVGYTQGINILLNIFFGPVVNAARAISAQVDAAASQFVGNYQTAVRPQIIKSYAKGEITYMHSLVLSSSKYGLYLMTILIFPILLFTPHILRLWLGTVPDYTVNFVRIMLITSLLKPLSITLVTAIHATGDIKKFQIFEGGILLSVVPITYILLKLFHISPEQVLITYLFIELFAQCSRIYIVLKRISMPYTYYIRELIVPLLITIPSCCILIFVSIVPKDLSIYKLITYTAISVVVVCLTIFTFGLKQAERYFIRHQIKEHIIKRKHNEQNA